MFGKFQKSEIRIEVKASTKIIRDSLTKKENLIKWLPQLNFNKEIPEQLTTGVNFTNWVGLIPVKHEVEFADGRCLRFILSQGIDGYHEWHWGDNWIQSRLEGVTFLPLNLGQTLTLLSLREFVNFQTDTEDN
jgi:hypothetical protein